MDGLISKMIARMHFEKEGVIAEYFPVNYNHQPPDLSDFEEIYILDFSYPKSILRKWVDEGKKLVVLDHHKTAAEELAGETYAVFDMEKSGAGLTWDYFHPGEPMPDLVSYVQDRDLWKFERKMSKPIHAGILACMGLAEKPDDERILEPYLLDASGLSMTGEGALAFQQAAIRKYVEGKRYQVRGMTLDGQYYRVAFTNMIPELTSDLCNQMLVANRGEFEFAIAFIIVAEKALLSIRSEGENDGTVLARSLAASFGNGGGGGHRNASGCSVSSTWLVGMLSAKEGRIDQK